MANLSLSALFGEPHERIEVEPTLRRLKCSRYKLAKICDVNKATVSRWRKWIPKDYHEKIQAALAARK